MLVTLALFIFPVMMAYAASSDLLTMRIANWLVVLWCWLIWGSAWLFISIGSRSAGPRSRRLSCWSWLSRSSLSAGLVEAMPSSCRQRRCGSERR